jgi:hypothetical protein
LFNKTKNKLAQRLLKVTRGMSPYFSEQSKERMMHITHTKPIAMAIAGFLATCAGVPAYSADQYGSSPSAPASAAQPTHSGADPMSNSCTQLDANHDGYISKKEFMASGMSSKEFKVADAANRGKLNMEECTRALANTRQ